MRAPAALRTPVIRLHPEAQAAFVQALYQDVVIATRCLVAAPERDRFLVGAGKGVHAPAPLDWISEPVHPLILADEGGFSVAMSDRMTGEIIFEDRSVRALAGDVVLAAGAQLRIGCGPVAFLVGSTTAPAVLPPRRSRPRDFFAALAAAAGLLLVAVLVAVLPPSPAGLSGDTDTNLRRWAVSIAIPPIPPPRPPVAGRTAGDGKTAGSAPPASKRSPRPSTRAGAAPRPSDPDQIARRGILEVLTHKGALWKELLSPHAGLADQSAEVLRDLRGGDMAAATSAGGLKVVGSGAPGPGGGALVGIGDGLGPCVGCGGVAGDRLARLGPRTRTALPEIRAGDLTTRGSLDKEIVRRVIRQHLNEVKYCYERELLHRPSLGGRVAAQFTILPTGRVATAVVASSTLANAAVEACIIAAIRRWEFPVPRGAGLSIVAYPFLLVPAGTQ
jgi:hypothetical protein